MNLFKKAAIGISALALTASMAAPSLDGALVFAQEIAQETEVAEYTLCDKLTGNTIVTNASSFNADYNEDGYADALDVQILEDIINRRLLVNDGNNDKQISKNEISEEGFFRIFDNYDFADDGGDKEVLSSNDYIDAHKKIQEIFTFSSPNAQELTVKITGIKDEYKSMIKHLVIPSKYCYNDNGTDLMLMVDGIAPSAFAECKNLESVEIMDYTQPYVKLNKTETLIPKAGEITANSYFVIENSAFADCTNLESVELPQNIAYIAGNAFTNTKFISKNTSTENGFQLISDTSGDTVFAASFSGIYGENGEVTVPENVTALSASLFNDDKKIKSLILPSTIKCIGMYQRIDKVINTFSGCTNIEDIRVNGETVEDGKLPSIVTRYLSEFDETKFVTTKTMEQIDHILNDILNINDSELDSEFKKAEKINEYIRSRVKYSTYYELNHTYTQEETDKRSNYLNELYYSNDLSRFTVYSPSAAFFLDYTECQGYAGALSLILDRAGIKNCCMGGPGHAFNAVYCEGVWYKVDLTVGSDISLYGPTRYDRWTARYEELDVFRNISMPDGTEFTSAQINNQKFVIGDVDYFKANYDSECFGENNEIVKDLICDYDGNGISLPNEIKHAEKAYFYYKNENVYNANILAVIGDYNNDEKVDNEDLISLKNYVNPYAIPYCVYTTETGWYVGGFTDGAVHQKAYFVSDYAIGDHAFENNLDLTELLFVDAIPPRIGDNAFAYSGVTTINGSTVIDDSNRAVIMANPDAFVGTPFYKNNEALFHTYEQGYFYNYDFSEIIGFKSDSSPHSTVNFSGTVSIADHAFANIGNLYHINFEDMSNLQIGDYAFADTNVLAINGSTVIDDSNRAVIMANPDAFLNTPFYAANESAFNAIKNTQQ